MKPRHLIGAATATLALVAAGVPAASAAPALNDEQTQAAAWLVDQIPGTGLFESHYFDTHSDTIVGYVDHGLNLDVQHALRELGQSSTADSVYDAVRANAADYTDAWGTRYSGAIGKLATYVELAGDDATNVDGRDLIADLVALMQPTGQFLNDPAKWENNIGQAWGVRALALSGHAAVTDAAGFLLGEQCPDGGFRENPGTIPCASSVDTTAFAIEALDDVGGHATEIDRAVAFLKSKQTSNGSLVDAGSANANSTGLAALAFAAHGEPQAAKKAAVWLASLQLDGGPDAGAIAATTDDHDLNGSKPLDELDQVIYVRATFQAALALAYLPEITTLRMTSSTSSPKQGQTVTINVTALDADGDAMGDVSDQVTLVSSVPTDTIRGNTVTFNHASPHTITVTHTASGLTGTITLEVAAAAVGSGAGSDADRAAGPTAAGSSDALPDTGSPARPWELGGAVALVVLGAALVAIAREKALVGAHRSGSGR
ncbi:MAG TPA: prenyltransferase/squalene oxidase repeat-containing protein [Aeromicrobium sp.]|nr:prenyltransferase/squalene oxidase repeat-containing protein [Aeromicrobium sp.]